MFKVGLFVFSESRNREDVYRQRKPIQDRETARFMDVLSDDIEFVIPSCQEIRGKRDIRTAVAEMETAGVGAAVFLVPIFISPVMVAHAARLMGKPVVILGNSSKDTFSQLAVLAAGGAADQIGVPNKRLPGDIEDPATKPELLRYLKAVDMSRKLRGMTFGCIGGRSLGISTGVADLAQWERIFGVDIEHIDQLEIVLRAQKVSQDKVDLYRSWIQQNYGAICFKEGRFDEDRLEKQIRSYLAAKSIIDHYELDFMGIKCQTELSNGYALQCLSVQMMNDPYDAEGPKEPFVCSCEADNDGALTMQILKLISGGLPTALLDIFHISDGLLIGANCGSQASYFAALSDVPKDNLKEVHLQPHGFGEAGGASTQFVCAEDTFTYARLFRVNGEYRMAVLKGNTEKRAREALNEFSWYRPTAFANINIDSDAFMREYGSNHIHCVRGDHVKDLLAFCEHAGIECKEYSE